MVVLTERALLDRDYYFSIISSYVNIIYLNNLICFSTFENHCTNGLFNNEYQILIENNVQFLSESTVDCNKWIYN